MGGLVQKVLGSLNGPGRSDWLPIITCTFGIVAHAASECVGGQILQTVPGLATMGGDGLGLGAITMELGANGFGALLILTVGVLWNLAPRFVETLDARSSLYSGFEKSEPAMPL
jgi:hypothetical protein